MIKAIVFDWFGVCTKENWGDCIARELKKELGLDEEKIREDFHKLLHPFASDEISADEFLKRLILSLDKKQDPKRFRYLFGAIPELNTELLEWILEIKKNYKVFLLSNNFGPVFPNYEKKIDFKKYFDRLFLSHEMKMSKIQGNVWEIVLPKLGFKPSEILFIDNKEKYLERPMELGINTILFRNNSQLKSELAKLRIKIA